MLSIDNQMSKGIKYINERRKRWDLKEEET